MKSFHVIALVAFFFLASVTVFGALHNLTIPEVPPSDDLRMVLLDPSLVPLGFTKIGSDNFSKWLGWAGWQVTSPIHNWGDIKPGVFQAWKDGNSTYLFIKYGLFESESAALSAVKMNLIHQSPETVNFQRPGSFSGVVFGDSSFWWSLALEKAQGSLGSVLKGDDAIICFSKGRYAILIRTSSSVALFDSLDKVALLEGTAKKAEIKIDIAINFRKISDDLDSLIPHKGIRQSLAVKLENFIEHFVNGDYKKAGNVLNAFINFLDAQRGKHVSEAAFQTLKGYTDKIVHFLNTLMQQ